MAIKKNDKYKVSTKKDPLNIRSSPNGKIIGSVPKDKVVSISNASKCSSTWLYIVYNGKSGYASKQYLTKVQNKSNSGKKNNSKKNDQKIGTAAYSPAPTNTNTNTNNTKKAIKQNKHTIKNTMSVSDINFRGHMMTVGLYTRKQIANGRYNNFFRYGHIDPYYNINGTREYIFFTRPRLNIIRSNGTLNPDIQDYPFFQEMYNRYYPILKELSLKGTSTDNRLSKILSYHVSGSLDLPSVDARMIDGPENIYGVGVSYRGDGRTSDFGYDFSLQFTDDKLLTCYRYFKAWEEYERLKKDGLVNPPSYAGDVNYYQANKILHDQIGIYKFIVGEDGREILYYAYYCGCFPKTVPRDAFNDLKENPSYNIDWHCFKVIDTDPRILYNFNALTMGSGKNSDGYNFLNANEYKKARRELEKGSSNPKNSDPTIAHRVLTDNGSDMTLVKKPFISRVSDPNHPSGYTYQLLWYTDNSEYNYYRNNIKVSKVNNYATSLFDQDKPTNYESSRNAYQQYLAMKNKYEAIYGKNT